MNARKEGKAFDIIARVIREWDPYGLLRMGCPIDEFDTEIKALVRQLPRIASRRDATLAISRVFSAAFDPDTFQPAYCEGVGDHLFAALAEDGLACQGDTDNNE